jgi:hypothetical protein
MKKVVVVLFLGVFGGLFWACNSGQSTEIETLNKELMAGHDEVMPKSMGIVNIKKEVLASIENGSDSLKNRALEINTNLQKAEDDMYKWMDDYGKAMNEAKNDAEKLALYKGLKMEIEAIKLSTSGSIKEAKDFMEANRK